MIPIVRRNEPQNFDKRVRKPGNQFIHNHGVPTKSSKFRNYWKDVANEIHELYDGICAYTCTYLLPPGTIDHFFPKMKYPQLAYEWSNYRLASDRVNQRKGEKEGLIDPFDVQVGWFQLDFPSCLVFIGDDIPADLAEPAQYTIKELKLNDDDPLVQDRCDLMVEYAQGGITLSYLDRRYPFLAIEIRRQNIEGQVSGIFRSLSQ